MSDQVNITELLALLEKYKTGDDGDTGTSALSVEDLRRLIEAMEEISSNIQITNDVVDNSLNMIKVEEELVKAKIEAEKTKLQEYWDTVESQWAAREFEEQGLPEEEIIKRLEDRRKEFTSSSTDLTNLKEQLDKIANAKKFHTESLNLPTSKQFQDMLKEVQKNGKLDADQLKDFRQLLRLNNASNQQLEILAQQARHRTIDNEEAKNIWASLPGKIANKLSELGGGGPLSLKSMAQDMFGPEFMDLAGKAGSAIKAVGARVLNPGKALAEGKERINQVKDLFSVSFKDSFKGLREGLMTDGMKSTVAAGDARYQANQDKANERMSKLAEAGLRLGSIYTHDVHVESAIKDGLTKSKTSSSASSQAERGWRGWLRRHYTSAMDSAEELLKSSKLANFLSKLNFSKLFLALKSGPGGILGTLLSMLMTKILSPFKSILNIVKSGLGRLFGSIFGRLGSVFSSLLRLVFGRLGTLFGRLFGFITGKLGGILQKLLSFLPKLPGASKVLEVFNKLPKLPKIPGISKIPELLSKLPKVGGPLSNILTKGAGLVSRGVGAVGGLFSGGAAAAGSTAASVASGAGGLISSVGSMALKVAKVGGIAGTVLSAAGAVKGVYDAFSDPEATVSQKGAAVGNAAGMAIGGAIGAAFGGPVGAWVGSTVGGYVGEWVGEKIAPAVADAWNGLTETWDSITSTISKKWDDIKDTASKTWDGITSTISNTWEGLKTGASDVWNGITSTISGKWDDIKDTASKTWDSVTTTISDKWDSLKTGATDVWNGITSTISGKWDDITKKASETWDSVSGFVSGTWTNIKETASKKWEDVTTFVSSKWDAVTTKASETWKSVTETASNMWDGAKNAGSGVWDSVTSFFTERKEKIVSSVKSGDVWEVVKAANPIIDVAAKAGSTIGNFFSNIFGGKEKDKATEIVKSAEAVQNIMTTSSSTKTDMDSTHMVAAATKVAEEMNKPENLGGRLDSLVSLQEGAAKLLTNGFGSVVAAIQSIPQPIIQTDHNRANIPSDIDSMGILMTNKIWGTT